VLRVKCVLMPNLCGELWSGYFVQTYAGLDSTERVVPKYCEVRVGERKRYTAPAWLRLS